MVLGPRGRPQGLRPRARLQGLHGRSLGRACPYRLAWRRFLLRRDDRALLEARRDGLLDRAVGAFPSSQGIEACLLRLIERKLERRVPVEALKCQLRACAPIAVDPAEIAADALELGKHVLRELLARG